MLFGGQLCTSEQTAVLRRRRRRRLSFATLSQTRIRSLTEACPQNDPGNRGGETEEGVEDGDGEKETDKDLEGVEETTNGDPTILTHTDCL